MPAEAEARPETSTKRFWCKHIALSELHLRMGDGGWPEDATDVAAAEPGETSKQASCSTRRKAEAAATVGRWRLLSRSVSQVVMLGG